MKKLIPFIAVILFLNSCKADSAFGGGLWIIPLVAGLGSVWSFGRYFFGLGSDVKRGKGALVFGSILALATIAAILLMLHDK